MKMQDLTGKVAVVTGASSGIGEATARLLVQEGVHVVLVARRRQRLEALAAELGEAASIMEADVADSVQVGALFKYVGERFGGLDLLFNNAGLGIHAKFESSQPDDWKKMIDANLYGVLNCTQAAIPHLRGREGAMICSVSSVGGRYGVENWSVYSATKYAVVGFHDALRKELGPERIRVTVIEPGAVWTEFGENVSTALNQRREQLNALTSENIAQALVYAFAQPGNVLVEEILIRPVLQVAP
ncbi:SDR family oxidoreductase [Glaciimonas sp. CA11.2]|uniref:SDR family oxidoreductase n=1 Tax=unclassified Glaciimonas TaxID=2644401 RepID=UPI002AB3C392|nr:MULTISPECIES: SDR family oxidoreductase [unclassified Glaciimonas]MDY7545469.1 SDR family oxidoreductase [Glaciimonas sp. CA11.2]MEB0012818.1 SDR family oxidoreductase [Glaciimonas sp. Cout2]MEB0082296.1 SDR family oxidoreductase [Glaciimonas sp. Gout2]MEB0163365.1 SDR family oxidoreductase [Glaciimonas sp. CA11.2]